MASGRIWIARHGETDWNREGRAQGQSDIALNVRGRAQAEGLARLLAEAPVAHIWSSDLSRARETAAALATSRDLPIQEDPRLRERGFGDWEGLHFDLLRQQLHDLTHPDDPYALHATPPGGESALMVRARAEAFLNDLPHQQDVLIVTHGMTGAMLVSALLQAPAHLGLSFRFGNAAFSEFERNARTPWRLVRYNQKPHVEAAAPVLP